MTRALSLPAILALAFLASPADAQPLKKKGGLDGALGGAEKTPPNLKPIGDYADAKLEVIPAQAKAKETVVVRLTITPKNGGHTYPFFPKDPSQDSKNDLRLPEPGSVIYLGKATDPAEGLVRKQRDGKPAGVVDEAYETPVTWEFKAVVSPDATPGRKTIDIGRTRLQACKERCVPLYWKELPVAELEVLPGESDKVNQSDLDAALKLLAKPKIDSPGGRGTPAPAGPIAPAADPTRKLAKPLPQYESELAAIRESLVWLDGGGGIAEQSTKSTGLWAFLATAALWGLISLVTPCVFPMIPITVSIFLKQAHGSLRERLKLAGVYCLTIITVLGVSAFALLKFMAWLSAHPVTNLLLAALFLVLALSLFGMYELTLPNFMVRRLQAKQAKGGVVGTVFGALAFTVISFTCVAPFLGGFAGISAADTGGSLIAMPTSREVLGGLAFATAFAAPFFVLALVPGLVRALPRSGGWLDSVKVVMGFLELAAALKFLRTAELRILPAPEYFTYDLVLGGWVAISAACGLYLFNLYRLPHDEERPNIGVPRLLFATLFLGLAVYLLPAMFKGNDGKPQRPSGAVYAWVEAFLLPESEEDWGADVRDAIERSKKSGRPVFVDFTGVTCTNCKYNELTVFSRPEIKEQLHQYERVRLYTDEVPASYYSGDPGRDHRELEAEQNRKFQVAAFKDGALPLYAVLMPHADGTVSVVGVYDEGKINAPDRFAAFLKDALAKSWK